MSTESMKHKAKEVGHKVAEKGKDLEADVLHKTGHDGKALKAKGEAVEHNVKAKGEKVASEITKDNDEVVDRKDKI